MSCVLALQPLLDAVQEAMLLTDATLRVVAANQSAERWFGHCLHGRWLRELIAAEHQPALHDWVHSVRTGGPPRSAELSWRCCPGLRTARARLAKAELLGQTFYTFSFLKPADPAGDCSEPDERFRDLIDSTFEGIVIHDNGVILEANAAAAEMTGYSRAELIGTRLSLLTRTEGDAGSAQQPPIDRTNEDTPTPLEFVSVARDGTQTDVEVLNKPIRYGGRMVRLTAFRDITAHKANERALKRRLEFDEIVATISAEFINLSPSEIDRGITDALGKIARFAGADRGYLFLFTERGLDRTHDWVQPGAPPLKPLLPQTHQLQGSWSMQQLQARQPVLVCDPSSVPSEAMMLKAELEHQGVVSCVTIPMVFEKRMIGALGFDTTCEQRSWSEETIELLQTAASVFASAIERKKVQWHLEQTVLARTRELRRKQLQLARSEKLASLGQLVAGVAHEINTPLGAIKSNNDVLVRASERLCEALRQPDAQPAQCVGKLLDAINTVGEINAQAIERIVSIVGGLRKFARLDEAELDTVDLHEGIDTTLTVVNHLLRGRVNVEKRYGKLPLVECYPNQLNQVFMNLLVNASQAIDGPGTITITTDYRPPHVHLRFSDDGRGMASEVVARIFDPGFTTKGVGVGTGLGLSIVHQIIEEHRGHIDVVSRIGEGTTFAIQLPTRLARPCCDDAQCSAPPRAIQDYGASSELPGEPTQA